LSPRITHAPRDEKLASSRHRARRSIVIANDRDGGNLFDAVQGFPRCCSTRGIVVRLENDARAQVARLQKNVTPDLLRFRVAVNPGTQPSEGAVVVFGGWENSTVEDVPKLSRETETHTPNQASMLSDTVSRHSREHSAPSRR